MSFTPTAEQQRVDALFATGSDLTINALAGSGKTTTLKMLANKYSSRSMVYTSFAASVIRDAKESFPRNVRASTNHSLAFATVGRLYANAKRLPPDARLTPRVLAQHFKWTEGTFGGMPVDDGSRLVMETLRRFCQSADPHLSDRHVPPPETVGTAGAIALLGSRPAILAAAHTAWIETLNQKSTLPVEHDAYLKVWALSNPQLKADVLLLDEAQDTNPLMIGVVLAQTHCARVVVGDPFQQIYAWRGAVNALDAFQSKHTAYLTQSFRFGDAIANAANAVLAGHLGSDVRVRGFEKHASRLEQIATPRVILARTNSTLIREVMSALKTRRLTNIAVVGGVDDLIRLVEGAGMLLNGERPARCPELAEFSDWDEVEEYSKTRVGRDLQVLVRLVDEHGTDRLRQTLEQVRNKERFEDDAELILSTAHKAKGREWPQVRLSDDFKAPPPPDATAEEIEELGWTPEDANVLYVAVTRARDVLDVSTCSAWLDANEKNEALKAARPRTVTDIRSDGSESAGAASDPIVDVGDHIRRVAAALNIEPEQVLDRVAEHLKDLQPAPHAAAGLR